MDPVTDPPHDPDEPRRARMNALALADPQALLDRWEAYSPKPEHTVVRGPESGLVMVRGRMGGGGAPFNVGEAAVTRCVVQLASGEVGFGHVMGLNEDHARIAAWVDAAAQLPGQGARIDEAIVAPLAAERAAAERAAAEEVAATRVEFFTMARGED